MNWIVIIPALNPDERLRKIVERNCELDNMVIVVDDGSQESCRPIFEGLRENCVILHHEKNQGKGAANVGARILSGGWNYLLNCRLVFQEKQSVRTAADYGALAVLILLCNSLLLQGFSFGLGIPLYLAKILTECTLFAISWLVQKKLIFKMKSGVCP